MSSAIASLLASGTKLWLDSIDPDLVISNRKMGATGATSNPIIVTNLIKTGRFDDLIAKFAKQGLTASDIAWAVTDQLVSNAESVFLPVWESTKGNDGYVSFELDPLLEDASAPPLAVRIAKYIELGKKWSAGHKNRMIKVPATPAGIGALEELTAAGVPLNVTLIFSARQYEAARDAIWKGAQRLPSLAHFKSVYSVFVSRIDIYTEKHNPGLSAASQGQVGILNAKRIYDLNRDFWKSHPTPLQQEMIFASTGTKKPTDAAWKYVAALAGSDIQTNPPETNDAVAKSSESFSKLVDQPLPATVQSEIDSQVNFTHLEETLVSEGLVKFTDPQKALLALIEKRVAELKS